MNQLVVKNPFSGSEIARIPYASDAEISKSLQQSLSSFEKWRHSPSWRRAEVLNHAADCLEKRRNEFVEIICGEAGKPVTYAQVEVTRAISVLKWSAGEAVRFSGEVLRLDASQSGRSGFGIHQKFPRGVILGITPFNFPLNLVIHKVAPAIASGCSILIKPSPFTPLTALKLAELFSEEPGLVQVVIAHDEATAKLTQAKEIAMISFTGSAKVGWQIRKQAPEKPTALELGGNAWVVVLDDIPLTAFPAISRKIAGAAYGYAGQSCISVQNAAIAASHWKEFQNTITDATAATVFGDPRDSNVISGPMIHASAAERVQNLFKQLPKKAERLSSSKKVGEGNALVAPSVILLAEEDHSALVQEEIFAPVMTARSFHSLEDVIRKINESRYGLQAGIFTQDLAAIEKLYKDLQVGGVIINDVPTTRYDHQPYGGVKDSGQGREGVRYAMDEMTESKFLALSSELPK